jgi:1-acyl-sn-glycerol-3-phosphate acyltransferase
VSSWFSRQVVGIIPLKRAGGERGEDVLHEARAALEGGQILIVFPEGTRGAPEAMGAFKAGVARLAEACPHAPVTPVYIQGAGRALPRNARVIVPFDITLVVGPALTYASPRAQFAQRVREAVEALRSLAPPLRWT